MQDIRARYSYSKAPGTEVPLGDLKGVRNRTQFRVKASGWVLSFIEVLIPKKHQPDLLDKANRPNQAELLCVLYGICRLRQYYGPEHSSPD